MNHRKSNCQNELPASNQFESSANSTAIVENPDEGSLNSVGETTAGNNGSPLKPPAASGTFDSNIATKNPVSVDGNRMVNGNRNNTDTIGTHSSPPDNLSSSPTYIVAPPTEEEKAVKDGHLSSKQHTTCQQLFGQEGLIEKTGITDNPPPPPPPTDSRRQTASSSVQTTTTTTTAKMTLNESDNRNRNPEPPKTISSSKHSIDDDNNEWSLTHPENPTHPLKALIGKRNISSAHPLKALCQNWSQMSVGPCGTSWAQSPNPAPSANHQQHNHHHQHCNDSSLPPIQDTNNLHGGNKCTEIPLKSPLSPTNPSSCCSSPSLPRTNLPKKIYANIDHIDCSAETDTLDAALNAARDFAIEAKKKLETESGVRLLVLSSAPKRVVACSDPMLQWRARVRNFSSGWTKVDHLGWTKVHHLRLAGAGEATARFSDVDRIVCYSDESQLGEIMRLIAADLSEPYSIYTYRYFVYNWPHLCFLAQSTDNVGEYVGVILCKLSLSRHETRRGYIAMLAVDPNYRRKKIATRLVEESINAMLGEKCDEVVLETEITNQASLNLYEKLGFIRDKRLFRYYLNGVDAYRLKLWLTEPSATYRAEDSFVQRSGQYTALMGTNADLIRPNSYL